MKFEKLGQSGRARRGRLTLEHGVVETPVLCQWGLTVQSKACYLVTSKTFRHKLF